MVSLTNIAFHFFLLFNIITNTSSMLGRSKKGQSSRSSNEEDEKIQQCVVELKTKFKHYTGFDNFLDALLDLHEYSFKDNEVLAKKYFLDLFDTLNKLDLTEVPDLWSPRQYCSKYQPNYEKECLEFIEELILGCSADVPGADCIKTIFKDWKKAEENPIEGTDVLTDRVLDLAIFFRNGYPCNELEEKHTDVLDAYLQKYKDYHLGHGILCQEKHRRYRLIVPFDKHYAVFLQYEMSKFGGSTFSDLTDFCRKYVSEQAEGLNENQLSDEFIQ